MKKQLFIVTLLALLISSCKKTETNKPGDENTNQTFEITGIWAIDKPIDDLKYVEFKDGIYKLFYETSGKLRFMKSDSFVLTDTSILISDISSESLKLTKNTDGSLGLFGEKLVKTQDQPEIHWFKTAEIESERTDVFSNNKLGVGTFGNQMIICRPDADYYDLINLSNFVKVEKWMKGTVPSVIEADDDLVYASSKSGYSLYIHLSSGGMAYEEIGGMGALKGICVQPSTPYVWLYSSNDTMYKFQKNTLKAVSKSKMNTIGVGDICWFDGKILLTKGSSIIEYDVNTKAIGSTYLLKGVKEIYGIANIGGVIWVSADGYRLIKLKSF